MPPPLGIVRCKQDRAGAHHTRGRQVIRAEHRSPTNIFMPIVARCRIAEGFTSTVTLVTGVIPRRATTPRIASLLVEPDLLRQRQFARHLDWEGAGWYSVGLSGRMQFLLERDLLARVITTRTRVPLIRIP